MTSNPAAPQGATPANRRSHQGIFITFEGGDGSGKSTHIRFLAKTLEDLGREVICLREPGGTPIGEKLRELVLDPQNAAMCDEAELFIYEAARAQLVAQVIRPALERGAVVLCDRFYDSTVAYQCYGRGLDREFVREANRFAAQGIVPDRTIVMAAPSATDGLRRATKDDGADRLEAAGVEFHQRVTQAFAKIAEANPDRIRRVVSADAKSQTSRKVFEQLADLFDEFAGLLATPGFFDPLDVKKPSAAPAASDAGIAHAAAAAAERNA